jgi:hypothetical protein
LVRSRSPLALCAILFAVATSGCGSSSSSPTASPVSDPNVIIARSLSGLQDVRTLHVEARLDGFINVEAVSGLAGGSLAGQLTGPMKLDNSTLSGDVDIAHQAVRISVTVPSLFGLTEDVIVVDGYVYARSSLNGDKYSKTKTSSVLPGAGLAPSASPDIAGIAATLEAAMQTAGVTATLVGRDKVDGRDAYHVALSIPIDKLNQAIASAGGRDATGMTVDSVALDYWAYVDGLQPARVQAAASSPSLGSLNLTVTLTKYNEPVTITPPPDSQVRAS